MLGWDPTAIAVLLRLPLRLVLIYHPHQKDDCCVYDCAYHSDGLPRSYMGCANLECLLQKRWVPVYGTAPASPTNCGIVVQQGQTCFEASTAWPGHLCYSHYPSTLPQIPKNSNLLHLRVLNPKAHAPKTRSRGFLVPTRGQRIGQGCLV